MFAKIEYQNSLLISFSLLNKYEIKSIKETLTSFLRINLNIEIFSIIHNFVIYNQFSRFAKINDISFI